MSSFVKLDLGGIHIGMQLQVGHPHVNSDQFGSVVSSARRAAQSYRRHRRQEFLRFLKVIDAAVPKDPDLHLVLDNYVTRKTSAIHQWHKIERSY